MDEELIQAGFDIAEMTSAQKELIMKPGYAPENFHQDGEITPGQALANWKQKMRGSGLSPADVRRAVRMQFGK